MVSVRNLSAVLVFAGAAFSAAFVAAQGNVERGRDLVQAHRCLTCHTDGVTYDLPQAPYITGQKIYYLEKQLFAFRRVSRKIPATSYKANERHHRMMDSETSVLSDSDIRDVAEYFSNLPCLLRQDGAPDIGEAPAKAQRCTYCHGVTGVNPFDIVPNLGGQKKPYLIDQLTALRDAALDKATVADYERFHRMMAPSVFDLTDSEIEGLADYYSRQSCRAERTRS